MELSGLIFVALALVWAVVLIPKALKHHDDAAQTRSVDRVSESMRVLARREVVSDREARLVVSPRGSQVPQPRPEAPAVPVVSAPRRPVDRSRLQARRAAAAAAARRRRYILGVLLLATTGVGVAAGVGVLLPWAPAVPGAVVLAYLALARVLVRKEQARWEQLVAEHRRTAALDSSASVEPVETIEAEPVEPVEPALVEPDLVELIETRNEQGLAVVSGLEDTASFPVGLLAEAVTDGRDNLWDPLPVTLPTYVTKPRATRSVRTIDLNSPGVSSSGRDAAESALVADAATATPPPEGPAQRAVGS